MNGGIPTAIKLSLSIKTNKPQSTQSTQRKSNNYNSVCSANRWNQWAATVVIEIQLVRNLLNLMAVDRQQELITDKTSFLINTKRSSERSEATALTTRS